MKADEPWGLRPEERGEVTETMLNVEMVRYGVRIPCWAHRVEEHDYGAYVAHALIGWFAALPERGHLEIEHPDTWWDYVKYGLVRHWPWLLRIFKVGYATDTYEAIHYLPAVELPEDVRKGEFDVWWRR